MELPEKAIKWLHWVFVFVALLLCILLMSPILNCVMLNIVSHTTYSITHSISYGLDLILVINLVWLTPISKTGCIVECPDRIYHTITTPIAARCRRMDVHTWIRSNSQSRPTFCQVQFHRNNRPPLREGCRWLTYDRCYSSHSLIPRKYLSYTHSRMLRRGQGLCV